MIINTLFVFYYRETGVSLRVYLISHNECFNSAKLKNGKYSAGIKMVLRRNG